MTSEPAVTALPDIFVTVPADWCFVSTSGLEHCPEEHLDGWPQVRATLIDELERPDHDRAPLAVWLGRRSGAYLHGGAFARRVPTGLRVDEWAATIRQAERDNLLEYSVWRHETGMALRATVRRRDAEGLLWYAVDHYLCGINGLVIDLRTCVAGLPPAHPAVVDVFADTDRAAREIIVTVAH